MPIKVMILVFAIVLHGSVMYPQTTSSKVAEFEVASINRNMRGDGQPMVALQPGGRFVMVNAPVTLLIGHAYPRPNLRLNGAPEWIRTEAYDITAKATGEATKAEMEEMLRGLLARRFNFAAHFEEEEVDAFELVFARQDRRLGSGLRRVDVDCDARAAAARAGRPMAPLPESRNGLAPCFVRAMDGALLSGAYPMAGIAERLEFLAGRPVMNRTNLEGFYEVTLQYRPGPPEAESRPGDPPILFTAIQEQLGLKLQPSRAVISTMTIDRIQRPSAN